MVAIANRMSQTSNEERRRHLQQINVTLAQLNPKLGDKRHNLNQIRDVMTKAKESGTDMVIFPEMFLTGYSVGEKVKDLAETSDGPSINEIKNLCKSLEIYTVFGFPEVGEDGHYYISSALIDANGALLGVYRKTHLFDQEKKFFQAGSNFKVIPTPLGKIGLMICYDVEFPEVARALKLMGADMIIIINANMEPYKDHHHTYAKARSMENEIPVVICNRLGQEEGLHFCGDSLVLDSWGRELLAMGESEGADTVKLPLVSVTDPKMNYVCSRKKDLYSVLTE